MRIGGYVFPGLLILLGGAVLILGLIDGQNTWVLLGAFLTLLTGVIAVLLQMGIIHRKAGIAIGLLCAAAAIFLAFRNYRSVAEVLEFNEQKSKYDSKIIQALKDIRTAQDGYKRATGMYTGNLDVLRGFVQSGTIPMIRSIGQVPDTLTELQALELKLIVRDTIQVPALDSLFRTTRALEKRLYPFDPNGFVNSPVSGKPFLLKAGVLSTSGRPVPVYQVKDPTPMVTGDTLMLGSLEKATTAGNWSGD